METISSKRTKKLYLEKVLGIVLLIPPILSSFLFLLDLYDLGGRLSGLNHLSTHWTGHDENGGYTSAAPIYLGLMAIGGAILLKKQVNVSNNPELNN